MEVNATFFDICGASGSEVGSEKQKPKKKKVREREEIRLAFAVVAITLHGVIFNDNSQTQRPQSGHVCVPVCVLFVYFNNLAMVYIYIYICIYFIFYNSTTANKIGTAE